MKEYFYTYELYEVLKGAKEANLRNRITVGYGGIAIPITATLQEVINKIKSDVNKDIETCPALNGRYAMQITYLNRV